MEKRHSWQMVDGVPQGPELRPHSATKVDLFERYFRRYVEIRSAVVRHPGSVFRMNVVDAFCGGGRYKDGRSGTGLRLVMAAQEVEQAFAKKWQERMSRRDKPPPRLEISVWLNDANQEHVECMREELRRGGVMVDGTRVRVTCMRWSDMLPELKAWARPTGRYAGKTLLILDQDGYKDVARAELSRVLDELPQAEILLTLSAGALLDRNLDDERIWKPGGAGDRMIHAELRQEIRDMRDTSRRVIAAKPGNTRVRQLATEVLKRFSLTGIVEQVEPHTWSCFTLQAPQGAPGMWIIHLVRNPSMRASRIARDAMLDVHSGLDGVGIHIAGTARNFWGFAGMTDTDFLHNDLFWHEYGPGQLAGLREQWSEDILRGYHELFDATDGVPVGALLMITENQSGLTEKERMKALAEMVVRHQGQIRVRAERERGKDWNDPSLTLRHEDRLVWSSTGRIAIQKVFGF